MNRVVRWVCTFLGLMIGFSAAFFGLTHLEALLKLDLSSIQALAVVALMTALSGLMAFFITPGLVEGLIRLSVWIETRVSRAPTEDIMAGAFGLIIGLIIAFLLGPSFARIPILGPVLPTIGSLVLGYLGISIALKKKDDLASLPSFLPRFGKDKVADEERVYPKILDTSVIIDGRIADICKSGFIEGPLIIPGFVLEELRHIADSSDTLKRNRGRRGLDILNRIRKELDCPVKIYERDVGGNGGNNEVDSKLVRLAQQLGGKVLTNDYNLNKVAELQGVAVLNINELANALKPVVLPGEEMVVQVIKDGKESGQGVAYLDDGTMIVVDGGKKHIGKEIGVTVTSVLQTAAGRMIFAKPKSMEKAAP